MAEKRIRVLLVDDHVAVRQGIRTLLEMHSELDVVGEASDGLEAVELVRNLEPDIVLMDVRMPVMNGIEATRQIRSEVPRTLVVGLSIYEDSCVVEMMKEAGAAVCVSKGRSCQDLYEVLVSLNGNPVCAQSQ